MNQNEQIARTIFSQISMSTKMACGIRKAVITDNGLMFQVGSGNPMKKIIVKLNSLDYYDVEMGKITRKGGLVWKIMETAENVDCFSLSEVIYHMVNK